MTSYLNPKNSIKSMITYRPSFGISENEKTIRLSANESAIGASKKVTDALENLKINPTKYPETQDQILKNAISKRYNLDSSKILLSNGSDELLSLICLAYLDHGDEAIHSEHAFLVIPQAIKIAGGVPIIAKDKKMTVETKNYKNLLSKKTKVIFLVNPNNPTGTKISNEQIINLHSKLPKNIVFVLDLAYAEYLDDNFSKPVIDLVENNENVIMTRTFSKLHGLAGLRLGWAYCSKNILTTLASIRGPFSVNSIASYLGKLAVEDVEFQKKAKQHNKKWISKFSEFLDRLKIKYIKSHTNFILIDFSNTRFKSKQFADLLAKRNILLRTMEPYCLNNYLRMSFGNDEEMRIVMQTFKEFLSCE